MKFSVVIPLYNKALHIERAVNSVLRQTCQDFEIIVVDDGSTDGSGEAARSIHDARIRLIEQPNQGVSAARNRGAEVANHPYIAFLDADDEWLPEFLQTMQTLIEAFPNCGAYGAAIRAVRPDGQIYLPDLSKLSPQPWVGILPNFFEIMQDGLSILHSSAIVVSKEILEQVGGFPVGVVLLEDITCWVKIALRYPIAYCSNRLVIYHQDATNRSNIHKNLKEAPFVKIIQEALQDGRMPPEVRVDAFEFMAQSQIHAAVANIINGNPGQARDLLFTCRRTKKYKKSWLWWRFWASLPSGWPAGFLKLKHQLLG